jgi:hypothetical protein
MLPTCGLPQPEKLFWLRFKNGCIFLKKFFSIFRPEPVFLVLEKPGFEFYKKIEFPKYGNLIFDSLTSLCDR